jgi:PKD repeat protein
MNKNPSLLKFGRALVFAVLSAAAGSAFATATFGTRVDTYCGAQPAQASAPQQSRPYRASNFSCTLCHTGVPSGNNLNAFGNASASCTSTTCGAAVNPFCVATPPSNATITAPAAGTSVTQGQSLTYSAGNPTNPDGFPLGFTWLFSGGMANATGQSVSVPMTVAGSITATLQVRNSVNMLASGTPPTRTVSVTPPANMAPTATINAPAGNVTVAQGGTVNFQGSGADPDNNLPLSYSWNFGGGAPNSTQQNPGAVTFNTAGTFTVSFTVTDSLGLASTAAMRVITVTPPANQAPVATIGSPAGNVTVAQGGTVNFQGSGADPDNNLPLTYSWNFGGGAPNSTQQNPGAVTFNTAGTFTVSFTVTDSLGLASTPVTRVVTVMGDGQQQPVAIIEEPKQDRTIVQGKSVEFHAKVQGGDDNISYNWSFPGGTPASSSSKEVKVTFNAAGTFTATLVVTNSQGVASAPVMRTITATPSPNAPVASINAPAGNVTIARGGAVSFMGSGTDPDNNLPLTYNWNFGGGAANSTQQNPGMVTFNTAGTFTVTFTVTDNRRLVSAPVTRTITVTPQANMAPTASIDAPVGNMTVAQGGTVTFRGSGTDPDNNLPLTYSWNFGGGAPNSTQQNPGAVTFNTAGTFTVTFTVTDSLGLASAAATRTIAVTGAAQQPVARIDDPKGNVTIEQGKSVEFQGTGLDPGSNRPLTYNWTFEGGSPAASTRQDPGKVRFDTAGTFTVTFTVTNSLGVVSAPATLTVTVTGDQRPVAAILAPAMNVSVLPGGTVMFRAEATGTADGQLRYRWRFSGGKPESSTRQNPGAVKFDKAGTFTVTLTVTGRNGRASTPVTRVITVASPNQLPRVREKCIDGKDRNGESREDDDD